MNRKELRAIANYQNQKEALPSAPLTVRIGNRDIHTGHYEVILPNGAVLKNGVKLFKASLPYGTEVEGKLSPNGQLFYLDYVDAPIAEEITEVEDILEDEPSKIIVLMLVIDITKSIETSGIETALLYLEIFLLEFPSAIVGYVAFGDNWTAVFDPTNPEDLITELQTQIDNYTGNYSGGGFWGSEGTDLPENGIDAIAKGLEILEQIKGDEKYLYLVTDNDSYSRNTIDAENVLNAINNNDLIKRLTIEFIEPVNSVSEHIIIQGEETNPYCTDSAVLTVLVNTEKINNYLAGSEILISNNTLIWQNGIHVIRNINNLQYRISPKRNISFTVAINIFSVVTKIFNLNNNLTAIRLSQETGVSYSHLGSFSFFIVNNSGSQKSIKIYAEFDFNNIITTDNTITTFNINNAQGIIININSLVAVTQWELVVVDDNIFYYYDISDWYNSGFDDGNWVRLGNTTLDEKTTKIINLSPITLSTTKTLFVNNSIIQSLEENDEVKVICQPQVVPVGNINNKLYSEMLQSDKIFYL